MSLNSNISVNGSYLCSIEDINYYNLTIEEVKLIVMEVGSSYIYHFLTEEIRANIVASCQKIIDVKCKSFIRDEKIEKILE